MKVAILTEGGKKFGIGHITRSISLYQAFKNKGIAVKLIVNGDSTVKAFLNGVRFKRLDWTARTRRSFKVIGRMDIVIVDSYCAPKDIYKYIASKCKLPVFIDDFNRLSYPRGVIISPSVYGDEIKYRKNKGLINLLGQKYVILRKDFLKKLNKTIKKKVSIIMVTFGGKDFRNMTKRIVRFLRLNFPDFKIKVNSGKKLENIEGRKVKVIFQPNAKEFIEIMLQADIAVSAGGQTLYELAKIGVPTIGICTAGNQRLNLLSLKNKGVIEYAGRYDSKNIYNNLSKSLRQLMPFKPRLKYSRTGKKMIDGKGSDRIVKSLLRLYEQTNGERSK